MPTIAADNPRAALRLPPAEATAALSRPPRVLVLTHRMPYPPDRGDRIRAYHLIRILREHLEVSLACTSSEPTWVEHHHKLASLVDRLAVEPISPCFSRVKAAAALLSGRPATPAAFFRQSLAQTITRWHAERPFHAVLTFCTGMIGYARQLMGDARRRPRHVLDLVDVDSAKWASYAAESSIPMRWVYGAESRRLRRVESCLLDPIDAVTVVSDRERDIYVEQLGDHPNLHVVGNGVDLNYFTPQPDRQSRRIVFIGVLDYKPNVDGVEWFARQVMPRLRQRVPDAAFEVVGRNPIARVRALNQLPGVTVAGSVPDVRKHLAASAAVVAPLRIARGVQNKVLEAMASARAVVCSPEAARGVVARDGEHLLIAREPRQWVSHIESLMTNPLLRRRLADAGRIQVQTRYNWEAQLAPMVDLLRSSSHLAK